MRPNTAGKAGDNAFRTGAEINQPLAIPGLLSLIMSVRGVLLSVCAAFLLALAGCSTGGPDFVAKREPWREDEENACLAAGAVRQSPFIQSRSALGGPSVCGTARPFAMSAAGGGRVSLKPAALLRCPMVPQVERWVSDVIEPAAQYYFGSPLVEMRVAASYACRPINHVSGGRLSEHGYANALDISTFYLANGHVVTVKGGWYGDERERLFLRRVHDGACTEFATVLGPESDSYHRDHFHVDLARHGRDGRKTICR